MDKVLQPLKAKLICSPAVLTDPNPPVFWVVDVLGLVVVLCFEDKEGWDRPAHCVDTSDQSYPLTITRLDAEWCTTSLRRSHYLD